MKVFPEIFSLIYKIILHLISLLTEQHELLFFRLKLNFIHRTDSYYISTRHCLDMLDDERMRRLKVKVNELQITAQSVRQTD